MAETDLICFSHLRWDDPQTQVRLRPLLARAARDRRVFLVEDPVYDDARPHLSFRRTPEGVMIAVPTLPRGTGPRRGNSMLRELVNHLLGFQGIHRYTLWIWNPSALACADHLAPAAIVYDCLGEPLPVRTAPLDPEHLMLGAADVVLAATPAAYHAKRAVHPNVHLLPNPLTGADPGAWDRVWAAAQRQIDRAIDARQAPLAIAK
jgi:hypothetical protein